MSQTHEPTAKVPIDKGMPQERTLLSWRRTAMTLVIVAFALARIALETSAIVAVIFTFFGFLLVTFVLIGSVKKYGRGSPELAGGRTTAMLSISAAALAITEIVLILTT